MENRQQDQNIKSIIRLEERVGKCGRCAPVLKCTGKPSVGRGDLQPDLMLVFEAASDLTRNQQWVVGLHNAAKNCFGVEQIYHTFMVRCQSRICPQSQGNDCFLTTRLLDRNEMCLLNNHPCDGLVVKPTNEAIINCLTFLLEEIAILDPRRIILIGPRVTEFVLKAKGIHYESYTEPAYRQGENIFIPAGEEHTLDADSLKYLAQAVRHL